MHGPKIMAIFLVPILTVAHADKLGQVIVEGAQAVMNPSTQGWEFAIKHVSA